MEHFSDSVAEAWHRHDGFTIQPAETEVKSCPYAEQFAQQAEAQYQSAWQSPSHVSINQALLQVCKKYWEWFYTVPKSHRNRVEGRGHRCIHAVFRETYERLKALELKLAPPMLFLPPPPPPPPPVVESLAGITLGEVMEEDS